MKQFKGYAISARDGDLGRLTHILFDDETWQVGFLVVETGSWLFGRTVLIPPATVEGVDHVGRRVVVALTRARVERCPDVDTHRPVSRRHVELLSSHYVLPAVALDLPPGDPDRYAPKAPSTRSPGDRYLRRSEEVAGCCIQAIDGDVGHVGDVVVDDSTWTIRYLVVNVTNFRPAKKVLIEPGWVEFVSWSERRILVSLLRRTIAGAPSFDASAEVTPAESERIAAHFANLANWA